MPHVEGRDLWVVNHIPEIKSNGKPDEFWTSLNKIAG